MSRKKNVSTGAPVTSAKTASRRASKPKTKLAQLESHAAAARGSDHRRSAVAGLADAQRAGRDVGSPKKKQGLTTRAKDGHRPARLTGSPPDLPPHAPDHGGTLRPRSPDWMISA